MAGPGQRVDEYMRDYRYPDPEDRDGPQRPRREAWRGGGRPDESRSFERRDAEARLADQFDPYRADYGHDRAPDRPDYPRGSRTFTAQGAAYGYGYGRPDYEPDRYTPNPREGRGEGGRDFWDKTRDEVASWFGDEDAHRRREWDATHSGKGPKNYKRSDARIHEDVNDRLMEDPYLDASDVEVDVKEGEVTLTGTVFDRRAKRHAEDLVERVSGVGHVQNNLRARPQATGVGYDAGAAIATGGRTSGMVRDVADGDR
jgi:hypothetical protein